MSNIIILIKIVEGENNTILTERLSNFNELKEFMTSLNAEKLSLNSTFTLNNSDENLSKVFTVKNIKIEYADIVNLVDYNMLITIKTESL